MGYLLGSFGKSRDIFEEIQQRTTKSTKSLLTAMIGVGFVAVVILNLIISTIFWFNGMDISTFKLPFKAKYDSVVIIQ